MPRHANPIHQVCQGCGKGFTTTPSRIARGWGRFCGSACMHAARKSKASVRCKQCDKEFEVVQSRLKNDRAKFCSRACQADWEHINGRIPLEDRFWGKVAKQASGCWFWTGFLTQQGYGGLNGSDKRGASGRGRYDWLAHRLSWVLHRGPIPEGMQVMHTCDQNYQVGDATYRRCVNPEHLRLGTNQDNHDDKVYKGRSNLPQSKLDAEKVRDIRARYAAGTTSQPRLAKEYGVSLTTIHSVIERWTWKHVF